jgi:hypothetical protein
MLTQFDAEVGYFNDSWLSVASRASYFIAVLCFAAGAWILPKKSTVSGLTSLYHTVAAYLLALVLAGFAVGVAILWRESKEESSLLTMAAAALVSAVYFAVTASRKERIADGLALMGFVPVLWAVLAIGETYVDPFTTINSPLKLALQMGFIGFMLLMTAELRFRLGKPYPRRAICLYAAAAFVCLVGSVPTLVGLAAGVKMDSLYPLYAAALLAAGVYAFLSFPRTSPAEPEAEIPDTSEEV